MKEFTRADLDFTEFMASRSKTHVMREAFIEPIRRTLTNQYDQETERLRVVLHQERKAA